MIVLYELSQLFRHFVNTTSWADSRLHLLLLWSSMTRRKCFISSQLMLLSNIPSFLSFNLPVWPISIGVERTQFESRQITELKFCFAIAYTNMLSQYLVHSSLGASIPLINSCRFYNKFKSSSANTHFFCWLSHLTFQNNHLQERCREWLVGSNNTHGYSSRKL